MARTRTHRIGVAALSVVLVLTSMTPGFAAESGGSPVPPDFHEQAWRVAVRAGLEHDLHGRHDQADAIWDGLETLDWADPEPWIRRVDTVYWRHFYDEAEPLDADLVRACLDHAKSLAKARLERTSRDLRARWLLGEALMQEARFEGMRGNYMQAGTAGEQGRKQLERVLEDDPENEDAPYMLGLYYYFSSLVPDFLRYVNWLWFVPKGNRDTGIEMLTEVRDGRSIYASSASMVLFSIYAYHAPTDLASAISIARDLRTTYPENAIIHFEMVEVLLKARRHDELLVEALALEQRRGESDGVTGRAVMARLWRARSALREGHLEEGRTLAFDIDPTDPDMPGWGAALGLGGPRPGARPGG